MDYIASLLFVISLLGETVADNQQRAFQNGKKEWTGTRRNNNTITAKRIDVTTTSHPFKEREYEDGFCQSGLFAIVRKPAYAFEQLVWMSYYLFSVAATADYYDRPNYDDGHHRRYYYWNWSMGGWVSLCILFQASGWLTERISMSKYPTYSSYRERVPLYVPGVYSFRRMIVGIAVEDCKKGK